jgi:hypothetical protein
MKLWMEVENCNVSLLLASGFHATVLWDTPQPIVLGRIGQSQWPLQAEIPKGAAFDGSESEWDT